MQLRELELAFSHVDFIDNVDDCLTVMTLLPKAREQVLQIEISRDSANECVSHSEKAIALTMAGNLVYNALEGNKSIERVTDGMPTPMGSHIDTEVDGPT
jgi:phosphotransferase system IIB component